MSTLKILQSFVPIATLLTILFLGSCSSHWTEKERQDFAQKCSQTDTIENLTFSLTGFAYNEIEKMHILHLQPHPEDIIDSSYVPWSRISYDSGTLTHRGIINGPICLKDTFQFIFMGQKPFILYDMKTVMWPQYTMYSEGYGCRMADYKINGRRYKDNQEPNFRKSGSKFSWEK